MDHELLSSQPYMHIAEALGISLRLKSKFTLLCHVQNEVDLYATLPYYVFNGILQTSQVETIMIWSVQD